MKATAVRDDANPARKPTDPKPQERPKQKRQVESGSRTFDHRLADEIWESLD